MLHADFRAAGQDDAPTGLDPFGFYANAASRLGGLGGTGPLPNDSFAFHTPYVMLEAGPACFTVRFDGLEATRGRLNVAVYGFLATEPHKLHPIKVRKRFLRRLSRSGEAIRLRFRARPGLSYAIHGSIYGDTDARAAGLSVDVATLSDGADHRRRVAEAQDGFLMPDAAALASGRYVDGPATIADPVSQMCTRAQMDEPAYLDWIERLRETRSFHRKQWEVVYILQVLARNGMLEPGRRGLAFGVGSEPLPALMASMGVEVVATDLPAEHEESLAWRATGQHASELDGLRRPWLCDDATLERLVRFRPADMTAIPSDLRDFDFTWSSCAYEHLGSIAAGLKFVEDSVGCLRPGGIAVHTTELNLSSNDATIDATGTVLFRRRDFDALAARLTAQGHWVAPINLDTGDTALDRHIDMPPYRPDPHLKMALGQFATTSFGMIVRRGG